MHMQTELKKKLLSFLRNLLHKYRRILLLLRLLWTNNMRQCTVHTTVDQSNHYEQTNLFTHRSMSLQSKL